jgi:transposase
MPKAEHPVKSPAPAASQDASATGKPKGKGKGKRKGKAGKSTARFKSTQFHKESYPDVNPHAGGVDIGDLVNVGCAPGGPDHPGMVALKYFPTHTQGCRELIDWLKGHGVESVAMESMGVLWVPFLEMAEAAGLKTLLVSPIQARSLPGKKTDVQDAQHLQHLHALGMLNPSYLPDAEICELRSLNRMRRQLVRDRAREIQRMVKACNQMNVKMSMAVSTLHSETGMRIVRAIVDGERNPAKLAELRDHRCHRTKAEIALALDGNFKAEHVYELGCALKAYDFFSDQLADNAARTLKCTELMARKAAVEDVRKAMGEDAAKAYLAGELDESGLPEALRTPDDPRDSDRARLIQMCHGVDVTTIPGISDVLGLSLVSELGPDLDKFPTSKKFCAWSCLPPGTKISGGKVLSSATRRSSSDVNYYFRMAAQGACKVPGPMKTFYDRMRLKMGGARAMTALAHKIARIFFSMLRNRTNYDPSRLEGDAEQVRARELRNLRRKAEKLGMILVENPDAGQKKAA